GYAISKPVEGPVDLAQAFDLDNDGDLDLVVVKKGKLALFTFADDAWSPSAAKLPDLPSPPKDVVPVDYDHDGDVDLLLVGAFGSGIGRTEGGPPVDATETSKPPTNRAFDWAIAEDFDGDNDVALLLGGPPGPGGLSLADSPREGKFADKSRVSPA